MAAAQAGFRIAAFDIFNDVETRRLCFSSERVAFSDGGFDADDLWRKLCAVDLADAAIIYGSGLENRPKLLDRISGCFPLLGNAPETVALTKDPGRFFSLLDRLGIAYPETRFEPPPDMPGWLVKQGGGSGGTHIRMWAGQGPGYYQRMVQGIPASLLFVADGRDIEAIGYNEQWLAPASGMPFRYGGGVGNADFTDHARISMANAARKVVAATGLRGLNSMDFMLTASGPLALEVNPRLSASFDFYDIPDLLEMHMQGCRGVLRPLVQRPAGSKAHLVYYAEHDVKASRAQQWPGWTADLPVAGTVCKAGEPLCSIFAQAADAHAAKALVFARARQLDAQLRTF